MRLPRGEYVNVDQFHTTRADHVDRFTDVYHSVCTAGLGQKTTDVRLI